jgi:ribulose-phosphate 3-epimerase
VHSPQIAPSILSADFARLADEVGEVEDAVEILHVDVMDGHYVPNITIGPPVVRSLRAVTSRELDCHLMITDPRTYAPQFLALGAESVTFHPEVDGDPLGLVHELHERGGKVGVAIKPAHPVASVLELLPHVDLLLVMTVEPGFGGQRLIPECVPKVAEAHALRLEHGWDLRIQVDGGIDPETIGETARSGADVFVAGSAVFGAEDRAAAAHELRRRAEVGRQVRA